VHRASFVIRSATKGRLAHSKLVLHEVSVPTVSDNDLAFFVGKTGEATTTLRPSGIAEFDGVRLNVVSDGEWIQKGRKIRVERVEGNRIVVCPVREEVPRRVINCLSYIAVGEGLVEENK
jgi:membrane-bound ClpP family serine protease